MKKTLIDAEKLQEICSFYDLKFSKFALKTGIKPEELYSLNSFKQKEFSRDSMIAIAKKCPEISPYWLITGEGSMLSGVVEQHNVNGDNLNNSTKDNGSSEVVKLLADTNASQQRTIDSQHKTIETLINIIHK